MAYPPNPCLKIMLKSKLYRNLFFIWGHFSPFYIALLLKVKKRKLKRKGKGKNGTWNNFQVLALEII